MVGTQQVSTNVEAKQIKGLLPSLDARVVGAPYVLDGRNFIVDLEGPRSYFYSRFFDFEQIVNPSQANSFKIVNNFVNQIVFCGQGFCSIYSQGSGRFMPQIAFTDSGALGPWYMAQVGTSYFFVRNGLASVVHYETATGLWEMLPTTFMPINPQSVTQSNGRLVICGTQSVAWSAQSNGADITPSLVTGAGFQNHTLVGGNGICALEVFDGYLVYTSAGVYKGEQVLSGINPFRHYSLDSTVVPASNCCVCIMQNREHVVLDVKGLYQYTTTSGLFEPWQPIFGEFLSTAILPQLDLTQLNAIKLSYSVDMKLLFISIRSAIYAPIYEYAFTYYTTRDEWGRFDQYHANLCNLISNVGPFFGFNFGFIDANGFTHKFTTDIFNELNPNVTTGAFTVAPVFELILNSAEYPATPQAGVGAIFRTPMRLKNYNPNSANGPAGFYNISWAPIPTIRTPHMYPTLALLDFQTNTGQTTFAFQSNLNADIGSWIEVGMFRMKDGQYSDELSSLQLLSIGVDKQIGSIFDEDWNTFTNAFEDYLTSTQPNEDWAADVPSGAAFSTSVTGLLDNGTPYFGPVTPALIDSATSTWFYACDVPGIYHKLRMETDGPSQSFHLKSLELSGMLIGRL